MNKEINGSSIQSNHLNSNNNKKIPIINNISLKKHLLKAKTNFISIPSDLQGLEDKSFENIKILLQRKQNSTIPLILPSKSHIPFINKIRLVSSNNNIFGNNSFSNLKNNYIIKLRNIKINKYKEKPQLLNSLKQNKSIINLNNENLRTKQGLDKYKIKNTKNIGNYSHIKYNYNLKKNSSVDSYIDNIETLRQYMKNIEDNINKQIIKRKNIRKSFFNKIGNVGTKGLIRKHKSLLIRPYIENNQYNSKINSFNL